MLDGGRHRLQDLPEHRTEAGGASGDRRGIRRVEVVRLVDAGPHAEVAVRTVVPGFGLAEDGVTAHAVDLHPAGAAGARTGHLLGASLLDRRGIGGILRAGALRAPSLRLPAYLRQSRCPTLPTRIRQTHILDPTLVNGFNAISSKARPLQRKIKRASRPIHTSGIRSDGDGRPFLQESTQKQDR